ncbi:MAG: HAMP domain-containing sensor histidine kinase [Bryobacteraceae bacterium]|nr:HAMP domain-containing sensor histidine kinase [Bryobacteraceae bacterium]
MLKGGRRRAKAFFITLGACMVVLTITLQFGWIVLNWRTGLLLVLGVIFFGLILTGVVLNTIFLIREIRRNEQHDAFINSVTHELKTPVASMRLYLQTLQSRPVTDEKRQEFYGIMLADSDRLLNTIEQVLRAARTPTAKPALKTRVDLHELVSECIEITRLRHHLEGTAFAYAAPSQQGTTSVMGDIDELRAAVSNLLDNAIKYGGQNVKVAVELTNSGAQNIVLRVRDWGAGIPPAELKRIFRRFYRVPSSLAIRVKGTGLGLFIVRSVAERHGGRAWAESEGPGRGSTFSLELPVAPRV